MELERRLVQQQVLLAFHPSAQIESQTPPNPSGKAAGASPIRVTPQDYSAWVGIESDDVATYYFPKTRPADRAQRDCIIGERLLGP